MQDKPFHIYRSSAGSGKTRTLAREYITMALRHPDYFKYILAVTFTNKSTQEMKTRVIRYLRDFREGKGDDLAVEIREALGMDAKMFRERSEQVLSGILHQYSQFSISTIDAFFQRVIRSFTRESGLLGNFRLEAEHDPVLTDVIAELMDEMGSAGHQQLTDWVIQFSRDKLIEGENWNLTAQLKNFAAEIFKDTFKAVGQDIQRTQEKIHIPEIWTALQKEKAIFMNFMKIRGQKAMELMGAHGITADDFSYKDQGTAFKYFREFGAGRYCEVGKRITASLEDPGKWAGKDSRRRLDLKLLAEQSLLGWLGEMVRFHDEHLFLYNSIVMVEQNFYFYGLISDIIRKLKDYQSENNIMLLSDASYFLNGVIGNSDTPFIYEKIGSFYRNYLIDEFQDTSELQWKNLRPLVMDGLDQNNRSLVVGDVKQSIYRWRGSDQGLLNDVIEAEVGPARTEKYVLQENWRSAENLVNFNNALFVQGVQRVTAVTGQVLPSVSFADLHQTSVKYPGEGFVRVRFFEDWKTLEEEGGMMQALHEMPVILEELQSKGIALQDIAILVRENREGQQLASYMLQYKNSPEAKKEFRYDVVSNESLRIDAASSVLLLVSAIKYLDNPDDAVARGELTYAWSEHLGVISPDEHERRFALTGKRKIGDLLPEEFIHHTRWLVRLSLFELVETLIRVFHLGENTRELAYLQSFQDLVLEFTALGKNDIASFLDWWEEMKEKRSITVAAHTPAASIYTIHKAKGLQFKYVILPFCSWPMGHKFPPLLWCRSEEAPFDQLGHVAVRSTSKLKESFFAADYEREHMRIHLDNLNLLYVAFTRAEEGLIVMAPLPAKLEPDKIGMAGHLVYESIDRSPELSPNFNRLTRTFTTGSLKVLGERPAEEFQAVALHSYPAVDWRKKLVIKREGGEFFQSDKTDQRKKINYGILMHRVLSHVHYKDDVENALQKLHLEGVIVEDEVALLRGRLKIMMDHPQAGSWFTREWQVRTEVPVIIPGGTQDRLDRVILKEVGKKTPPGYKAVIIDYKTGIRKSDDRKQVEAYSLALVQMGYVDVEGFLLYLDDLTVVSVVSKTNLTLF